MTFIQYHGPPFCVLLFGFLSHHPIYPFHLLSFCILIHYFRQFRWNNNKQFNFLLLKALRARPVWVLVIASAFPWCEWPTPIYWLIWLIRWWCGDGGDQLAGKSINWIQFWVRSSGETNWICGTGSSAPRDWRIESVMTGRRSAGSAGKLSKKLHNRQMPRINNGVKAEWPQKIGYNVRLLS